MAPKPRFNNLTTEGCIAKDAYERQQGANSTPNPTSIPPTSLGEVLPSAPPAKKKRRTTNHPPPHELAAEAAAKFRAKEEKKPKRKQALTKLEKQAAQEAKQRKAKQSVVHDGSSLRVVQEESAVPSCGDKRAKPAETRNLMDFMRDFGQMNATSAPLKMKKKAAGGKKKEERESVLVRATEKTERMKAELGQQFESKAKGTGGPGLMCLPLKLRQRIWRMVVVETQFFVYPISSPEQPDLAMTNIQIRGEVLPIYYGENTFAIEVPSGSAKGKMSKVTVSLKQVEKWASAMRQTGHLQAIMKWAFIWIPAPSPRTGTGDSTGDTNVTDQDAIVSLQYSPASGAPQNATPGVEVHKQAFCMLPGHKQYVPCQQKDVPSWLSDAVAGAILMYDDREEQVLAIAKTLKKKGGELAKDRCELLEVDNAL